MSDRKSERKRPAFKPWGRQVKHLPPEPTLICECGKNPDDSLWIKSPKTGCIATVKREYFFYLSLGCKGVIDEAVEGGKSVASFTGIQLASFHHASQMNPLRDEAARLASLRTYKHRGRRW